MVCACVSCGPWLRLPRMPVLLETPAAVMCCDSSWFLWLTALAGELLCHANEQMRRWAGLTADRRAALVTSPRTHTHDKRRVRRSERARERTSLSKNVHSAAKRTDISIPTGFPSKCDRGDSSRTNWKQRMIKAHTRGRVGITLLLHCVPLHQRSPQICSRQQANGCGVASVFICLSEADVVFELWAITWAVKPRNVQRLWNYGKK